MKHPPASPATVRNDQAVQARLRLYLELLLEWNRTIRLVAETAREPIWQRHILDSAQLAPLMPADAGRFVDIGSGAGFPGLVLAIVTDRPATLIEADRRKAAFLREAVRATGTDASVLCARVETVRLPPAPLVVARALAPLRRLLELAAPLLAPGGTALFPKGANAEDELTEASAEWHMRIERFSSATSRDATILRLSEIHRRVSDP